MPMNLALVAFAATLAQTADPTALLVATDEESSTVVRLLEYQDEVRFEFTGPAHILPSIAIDVNRNGVVDGNVDFQIGLGTDNDACFQYLLKEGTSSICQQPGQRAQLVRSGQDPTKITSISFPKHEVSGDGFGFGFGVSLWNNEGNYKTTLAGGDYRFGGVLSLVSRGPNFTGRKKLDLPASILPAFHRYEGCLHKAINALAPLDQTMAAKIKGAPAGCASDRALALREGVDALVATGVEKNEATAEMRDALDRLDSSVAEFAAIIEKGS